MFENDEKLLEKAKNDYKGRNYNSAVKKLLKLAKKQNAEAYYYLGEIYLNSYYQNCNLNEALKYYELSAQKGYKDAIIALARLYSNENNSCFNVDKALSYLALGAENDNDFCLYKMGCVSINRKDYQKAIEYFEACMSTLDYKDEYYMAESAFILGNMYSQGLGVEKDDSQYLEYYKEASDYGHKDAPYSLAQCYRYGYIVDKDKENAQKYYEIACENGNYVAMNEYGLWCQDELNKSIEAIEYFKEAIDYCGDYDIDFVEPYFHLAKLECVRYAGENYKEVIEALEYKQSQNKELTQKEMDMYIESLYELANIYNKDYSFWNSLGKKKSSDNKKMKEIFTDEELAEQDRLNEKVIYENTFTHDEQKAISLYEKAGYLGHNESLCQLAIFYKDGKYKDTKALMSEQIMDMIKDKISFDDVVKLRGLADDPMNNDAKSMVGYCYKKGVGVLLRDEAVAYDYISEAARLGNAFGIYQLALMYYDKNSLRKDYQKAFEWFEKAANRGSVKAINMVGYYYKSGAYTIAQNYQEAFNWFSKSAIRNDPYGNYQLATMYLEGLGISQDSDKAIALLEKAAHYGYVSAMDDLGFYYKNGQYVKQDYMKAYQYFIQSSDQDSIYGLFQLGLMYDYGHIIGVNYTLANMYYQKAIDMLSKGHNLNNNNKGILYSNLGVNYLNGYGTEKDYQKAYELLMKAESCGNSDAMYHIGLMYKNGKYVTTDVEKAHYYFEKAANKGHKAAKEELDKMKI